MFSLIKFFLKKRNAYRIPNGLYPKSTYQEHTYTEEDLIRCHEIFKRRRQQRREQQNEQNTP